MAIASKTASGRSFEDTVLGIVQRNGYTAYAQQTIGPGLGGGQHRVDLLVIRADGTPIPVSAKWQQVSGTAKEKVPYEVIKLIYAVRSSGGVFPYAYLILDGTEWGALGNFYLEGGLAAYIQGIELVRIVTLAQFMARANRQQL